MSSLKKSINAKKMQSELEHLCELYPKREGLLMWHDDKGVTVTVFTEKGMSEYKYGEDYLEGESEWENASIKVS